MKYLRPLFMLFVASVIVMVQTACKKESNLKGTTSSGPRKMSKGARIESGKETYEKVCSVCHQPEGQGQADFPPLANSDFLNADKERAIHALLFGLSGEIDVNGKKFNSVMPPSGLDDDEAANVLTYVYSKWGNNQTEVSAEEVAAIRAKGQ